MTIISLWVEVFPYGKISHCFLGGTCRTWHRFERTIHSAVYSPNGEMIATATDDSEASDNPTGTSGERKANGQKQGRCQYGTPN